ncbi:M60 family metallopeptidase [Chimaeribacter arupi]|uniref:M60 family metallopeptidase n=1 Tax=Chimaeribacter arupi TaxID=2060066 RepID=UPI00271208C9|nr:M60 family metallopeptidase [Chimaeribacter arupi]WKZ92038.1 M60 family metallopeptidase [Chimaeribacter arupi]
MKGHSFNKIALGLALALNTAAALAAYTPDDMNEIHTDGSDAHFDITESVVSYDTWWNDYAHRPGFQDALSELGLTLEQLNRDPNTFAARSGQVNDPLFWLKRTLSIYPADKQRYAIPVTENGGGAARQSTWERDNYFLTRTYARAGETVLIEVGQIPDKVTCYAANKTTETMKARPGTLDVVKLPAQGLFHYPVKHEGVIALGCIDSTETLNSIDKRVTMRIIAGGVEHPLFILGQQPRSQWASISQQTTPSGNILMFDGRSNYYINNAKARESTNTDMLHAMNQALVRSTVYDTLNGMNGSSSLHQPNRGTFTATYNACCAAGNWDGMLSIGFKNAIPTNASWGHWHEYGHLHQNRVLWWKDGLREVVVNIYSLAACYSQLGNVDPKKCHGNLSANNMAWDQQAVGHFLQSGQTHNFDAETNVFKQLGMFMQLITSYPDMYPALNRAMREEFSYNKNRALINTDQKKKDWFVVQASKLSGYDLRDFFDRWGLAYTASARDAIAAMTLPSPKQPVASYQATLRHNGNVRSNAILTLPVVQDMTSMGIVTHSDQIGPKTLVWSQPGPTLLKARVVDAHQRPFTVTLRAERRMGGCPVLSMNSAASCDGADYATLMVNYYQEDNAGLPAGHYTGQLPLIVTDWHKNGLSANATVQLDITQ